MYSMMFWKIGISNFVHSYQGYIIYSASSSTAPFLEKKITPENSRILHFFDEIKAVNINKACKKYLLIWLKHNNELLCQFKFNNNNCNKEIPPFNNCSEYFKVAKVHSYIFAYLAIK